MEPAHRVRFDAAMAALEAAPELLRIVHGFLATLIPENPEEEAVVRSYYNTNIALWNEAVATYRKVTWGVA